MNSQLLCIFPSLGLFSMPEKPFRVKEMTGHQGNQNPPGWKGVSLQGYRYLPVRCPARSVPFQSPTMPICLFLRNGSWHTDGLCQAEKSPFSGCVPVFPVVH